MVIGVNEHALSFATAKMTVAEWSVSGSPVHFRDRTMGALNAPAKVVSRYYIRRRALCARCRDDETRVNLISECRLTRANENANGIGGAVKCAPRAFRSLSP